MRKRRIVFLLCICSLALFIIVIMNWRNLLMSIGYYRGTYVFGTPLVTMESIVTGREEVLVRDDMKVYFENTIVPYDQNTKTFYLSQSIDNDEWIGRLSVSKEYEIYLERDDYWNDKGKAIRENHQFSILLVNGNNYSRMNLVITGMPLVSIETVEALEMEEVTYEEDPDKLNFGSEQQYSSKIRVFDPGTKERKYQILEMKAHYHEKGASTKVFEKKSYSLSLLDNKDDKLSLSLLGMSSDNSWKLNSLVTDSSKVREKTAAELWECFNVARPDLNESGPRMEYVELVIDNEYAGVYCLVEPIEPKKLELKENDYLYKVINWAVPDDEGIQASIDNGWKIQYPIRIRYPKEIQDYDAAWMPMRSYLNQYYRNQISEQLQVSININNLFDMVMFTMATSASDNFYKNTYYVAEDTGLGTYMIKQIPWDLDYTFGNIYRDVEHNSVLFDAQVDKIYIENAFWYVYNNFPDLVKNQFCITWEEYRNGFLSTENVVSLLKNNRDYLLNTGAYIREQKRWKDVPDVEIIELQKYVEERLNWLDGYFQEWK